jgi:hypothetical protein
MLDDLGDKKIDCLALAGIKLPKKGPIPDVPVRWTLGTGDLKRHGTLSPSGIAPVAKTDEEGISTLTFTPKDEAIPGLGVDTHDTGTVVGLAEWQKAFDNEATLYGVPINQYLTPIFDVVRWDVAYHNQKGTLSVESDTHDTVNLSTSFEIEMGSDTLGLRGQVPINDGRGGNPFVWTSFSYSEENDFPQNEGACYQDGSSAKQTLSGAGHSSGALDLQGMTGKPDVSITLGIVPAPYKLKDVITSTPTGHCVFSTTTSNTFDGGFSQPAVGVTAIAQNVYRISGWTPGAPRSGTFATKKIVIGDGTINLKITPSFG